MLDIEEIQNKVDSMGFRGGNEYDLHLREELADYLKTELEAAYKNGYKIGKIFVLKNKE